MISNNKKVDLFVEVSIYTHAIYIRVFDFGADIYTNDQHVLTYFDTKPVNNHLRLGKKQFYNFS